MAFNGLAPAFARADDDFSFGSVAVHFENWGGKEFNNVLRDIQKCDSRIVAAQLDPTAVAEIGKPLPPRYPHMPDDAPPIDVASAMACYKNMLHAYGAFAGASFSEGATFLTSDQRQDLREKCNLNSTVHAEFAANCIHNYIRKHGNAQAKAKLLAWWRATVYHQTILGACYRSQRTAAGGAKLIPDAALDPGQCYTGSATRSDPSAAKAAFLAENKLMMSDPNLTTSAYAVPEKNDAPTETLDSTVDSCMNDTFNCAVECTRIQREGGAQKVCLQDDIATEALSKHMGDVMIWVGERPPNLAIKDLYVKKLRQQALVNLLKAYGTSFGDHDILSALSGPCGVDNVETQAEAVPIDEVRDECKKIEAAKQKCFKDGNTSVGDLLANAPHVPLSSEEKTSNELAKSSKYRENMVRAADDIARNLLRYNLPYTEGTFGSCPTVSDTSCGGTSPDTDCPCMGPLLEIPATELFSSTQTGLFDRAKDGIGGDIGWTTPEARAKSCQKQCCGSPDGQCVRWGSGSAYAGIKKVKDEAKGAIERDLRDFPELAAGVTNPDQIYNWNGPLSSLPNVRDLIFASHPVRDAQGETVTLDPRMLDRGLRPININSPTLKAAFAKVDKRSKKDFAKAALKFCENESDGGAKDEDLMAMPGLVNRTFYDPDNNKFKMVQDCYDKKFSSDKKVKAGAQLALGVGCVALGVVSAGMGGAACSVIFAALSVVDYNDAVHRNYMMGQCGGTSAAGNCSLADTVKADAEQTTAGYMAAASAAGAVFEGAVGATKAAQFVAELNTAKSGLAADELLGLETRLQKIEALKSDIQSNPAHAQQELNELEAISNDASSLKRTHEEARAELTVAVLGKESDIERTIAKRYGLDLNNPTVRSRLDSISKHAKSRLAGAGKLSAEEEANVIDEFLSRSCKPK